MIRPILSRRSRRELYGWERPQKRGGPLASVWMDVRRFWARECVCIYVIRNPAGRCTIRSKSLEVAGRWFTLHLRRCVFSSAATVTVREEKKEKKEQRNCIKLFFFFWFTIYLSSTSSTIFRRACAFRLCSVPWRLEIVSVFRLYQVGEGIACCTSFPG